MELILGCFFVLMLLVLLLGGGGSGTDHGGKLP
jgi:hypothetical protein